MRRLWLVLAFLMLPQWASAATYYVAPWGSDGAAGSLAAPFETLEHALGVLDPGDTLYIRTGTYTERIFEVDFDETGTAWTAGNFITVSAYPLDADPCSGYESESGTCYETVTIRVGSGGNIMRFQDASRHHIHFKGFAVDGIDAGGLSEGAVIYHGDNSHHLKFEDMEVKDGEGPGILGSGDSHEYINLNVHGHGREGIVPGGGIYNMTNGAYLSIITNSTVTGGRYWDNECTGIRIGSSGVTNAHDNVIDGVRAYQNGLGIGLGGDSPCDSNGPGILIADVDNTVMNSLSYSNGEGITLYGLSGKTATGLKAYNNTVTDNDGPCFIVDSSLVVEAEIKNNICFDNGSFIADVGQDTDADSNPTGDPSFTNAAAFDFTITTGSSAKDACLTIAAVTDDFFGRSRPVNGTYDCGFHEFFGALLPTVTDVVCPASIAYTGSPLTPCTATVTGSGLSESLTVTYFGNTGPGTAAADASYPEDATYEASADQEFFDITNPGPAGPGKLRALRR